MMARLAQHRTCSLTRRSGRRGFTLVEVLVVLAILVILFGLLFMPIIASLDMVTVGQARVTMQTSVRTAMEEMRREISNAMYIYPTPGLTLKGPDEVLGTGDDVRIPNYSEIVFVGPRRDNGAIVEPLEPRSVDDPEDPNFGRVIATRYRVMLRDPGADYDRLNPFVLVREEGYYTYLEGDDERAEELGWVEDRVGWVFENRGGENPVINVLSPHGTFDIPVSRSVCTACGEMVAGYTELCPDSACGWTDIMYIHDNVQFRPERIVGELLQPSAENTLYRASHGSWAGLHNPGNLRVNQLHLGRSALDPRIMLLNPADNTAVVSDDTILTWNSDRGVVRIGAGAGRWIRVMNPNDYVEPGSYYELNIQEPRPDWDPAGVVDQYDSDGLFSSGTNVTDRQWDIVPIYPTFGPHPQPGDPAMPIAYRIDTNGVGLTLPKSYGSRVLDGDALAKILRDRVRVVVWAIDAANTLYQTTYTQTTTTDQRKIGRDQFAVVLTDAGQRAEILFNELNPPGPQTMRRAGINVNYFGIYIQYYYRRNYDPYSPETDYVVRADYSTREIMNLKYALQRHTELEESADYPYAKVVPEDAVIDRVSVQDQTEVRNIRR